jgi:F-type H+-transporting ATPase subunit b
MADEMLKNCAWSEASDIVTTAKEEAAGLIAKSEEKSKVQAERIVAAAHESIEKDVLAARKALHNETVELVAQATEKVVGKSVSDTVDKKIIMESIKEVQA